MKTRSILGGAIGIILLVSIVMAVIPPPPVNQYLGITDTTFNAFTETECRECHTATGTAIGEDPNPNSVADRHHLLVPSGEYGCIDCHPVLPDSSGISITRDCLQCHLATPHHETVDAQARHCSACHGSLVDDFDDGHYIPTYPVSLVTPDTSYKVLNETTDKKWGGCEACHEGDATQTPPINENFETHHNLGTVSNTCETCHFGDGALNIRKCEDCHGVKSLHNIQYDYVNTSGMLGYGHIGANWDCNGCHAFWDAGTAPMEGLIIPEIESVSADRLVAGQQTVLRLEGTNFVTTTGSTTYTSDVVVDDGTGLVTLTPDSITGSEIVVTLPALDAGVYGLYVVKADMKSKLAPIVVSPDVTIESAVDGDNVVITGSGFGDRLDAPWDTMVSVTIQHPTRKKTVELPTDIVSWSDTEIVVNCPDASSGDQVTVNALFSSARSPVMDRLQYPQKKPTPPKK